MGRLAFAAGVAVIAGWVFLHTPGQLTPPIDIVGHPTFSDFNYLPTFRTVRGWLWVIPLSAMVAYELSRRWGPLRATRVRTSVAESPDAVSDPDGSPLAQAGRVAVGAVVAGVAVSALTATPGAGWSWWGALAAVAYVAAVVVAPYATGGRVSRARANAVGLCFVALVGPVVWSFSARAVADDGVRRWSWLPWWLVIVGAVALAVWWGRRARHQPAARVEAFAARMLAAPVAIFIAAARLPGAYRTYEGFDDSQGLVGGDLIARGYVPWRDFMFIHGLWDDGLRGNLAFALFEPSRWGMGAVDSMVLVPAACVGAYFLAVWAGRHSAAIGVMVAAVALWGGFAPWTRWVAVSVAVILLGQALRSSRRRWSAIAGAALTAYAVVTPEATLLLVIGGAVLALRDIVHRPSGGAIVATFRRTLTFVAASIVTVVIVLGVLALMGALGAFIDYYRVFGPGHAASGAVPVGLGDGFTDYAFLSTLGLAVFTLVLSYWRIVHRRQMTPTDWLVLATALVTAVYAEKAFGRFDEAHMQHVLSAAIPLWVLSAHALLGMADRTARRVWAGRDGQSRAARVVAHPASLLLACIAVAATPGVARAFETLPGRVVVDVPTQVNPMRTGYVEKGTVDVARLQRIDRAITTYAGRDGEVFDFTDSLGQVYFLMARRPASSYVHVSMAVNAYAQRQVIDELRRRRPPVVLFSASGMGLGLWDGISQQVRHHRIAAFLLDGWTPVESVEGVLIMQRNDRVRPRPRPQVDALYQAVPACQWGYAAAYLPRLDRRELATAVIQDRGMVTYRDAGGWAFDPATGRPVTVLFTIDGREVARATANGRRPDVATALGDARAARSGFQMVAPGPVEGASSVYALLSDGRAHPVPGFGQETFRTHLTAADGRPIPVENTLASGYIDNIIAMVSGRLGSVEVPAGLDRGQVDAIVMQGDAGLGVGEVVLLDPDHGMGAWATGGAPTIRARVPAWAGTELAVPVANCPQWRGYQSRRLDVLQTGSTTVTRLSFAQGRP